MEGSSSRSATPSSLDSRFPMIESVIRYSLNTSRPKGSMGRLVLTNISLNFINYTSSNTSNIIDDGATGAEGGDAREDVNPGTTSTSPSSCLPPFDIHSFLDEPTTGTPYDDIIDFVSIHRVEEYKQDSIHTMMSVFCLDFRRVDFLIKENEESRVMIDHFVRLVSPAMPTTTVTSSVTSSASTLVKNMSANNLLSYGRDSSSSSYFNSKPRLSSQALHGTQYDFKRIHRLPVLWYEVTTSYRYFDVKDWECFEGYWLTPTSPILRISQVNEALQLSKYLPKCFISLASVLLSDVTLMQSISTQMNGSRVPLVSFSLPVSLQVKLKKNNLEVMRMDNKKYSHPKFGRQSSTLSRSLNRSSEMLADVMMMKRMPPSPRPVQRNRSRTLTRTGSLSLQTPICGHLHQVNDHHFLFRSVTLTEDVSNLLRDKISPLRVFDLNREFNSKGGYVWFEKAHRKLLEAVFVKSTKNFIMNTGKWMKRVCQILSIVNDVVSCLLNESSVILTEDNDNLFNPLISTLVQVILDQNRRTIKGLEALISKEWMFMTGFANGFPNSMTTPNPIIFSLLIDCLHQILAFKSNSLAFEFTSLYLIRLYDKQFMSSPLMTLSPIKQHHHHHTMTASFEDLTRVGHASHKSRRRSSLVIGIMTNLRFRDRKHSSFVSNNNKIRSMRFDSRQEYEETQFDDPPEGSFILETKTGIPISLSDLSPDQLLLLFNPMYDPVAKNPSNPGVNSQVLKSIPFRAGHIGLFEGLYLRWIWIPDSSMTYYTRFPILQQISFDQVLLLLSGKKKQDNSHSQQEDEEKGIEYKSQFLDSEDSFNGSKGCRDNHHKTNTSSSSPSSVEKNNRHQEPEQQEEEEVLQESVNQVVIREKVTGNPGSSRRSLSTKQSDFLDPKRTTTWWY